LKHPSTLPSRGETWGLPSHSVFCNELAVG
jgi:hypothetical protein